MWRMLRRGVGRLCEPLWEEENSQLWRHTDDRAPVRHTEKQISHKTRLPNEARIFHDTTSVVLLLYHEAIPLRLAARETGDIWYASNPLSGDGVSRRLFHKKYIHSLRISFCLQHSDGQFRSARLVGTCTQACQSFSGHDSRQVSDYYGGDGNMNCHCSATDSLYLVIIMRSLLSSRMEPRAR